MTRERAGVIAVERRDEAVGRYRSYVVVGRAEPKKRRDKKGNSKRPPKGGAA